MKVHPQQQADTSRIPAYHRRKDAATDHMWRSITAVSKQKQTKVQTKLINQSNKKLKSGSSW